MKIAYTFGGHLRTFKQNQTLIPNLMGPNPGDIFVYTYARHNVTGSQWHGDRGNVERVTSVDDLQWIRDRFAGFRGAEVSQKTCGSQGWPADVERMGFRDGWCEVQRMRRFYEGATGTSYDLVFNCRWDLYLAEPIVFPAVLEPDTVYGGLNPHQLSRGFDGEVFLYGRPDVMDRLLTPAIPDYLRSLIPAYGFNGESLVTAWRKNLDLRYVPHPVGYGLLRSSGDIHWVCRPGLAGNRRIWPR